MKIKDIMKTLFISFFIVFISSSCISTKWYETIENKSSLEGGIKALNGMYSNRPADYNDSISFNQNSYPLYTLLFEPNTVYKWDEYRSYGGHIKIEAISDKKIKASYMVGEKVLEEKVISGKIENDIFSVKRKVKFLFLVVYNYYNEIKTSIYIDGNGDLVVYNAKNVFSNILFMSGGGDNGNEGRFSKIHPRGVSLKSTP